MARTVAERGFCGEPCEGEPHARFGEGPLETRPAQPLVGWGASAPAVYSTGRATLPSARAEVVQRLAGELGRWAAFGRFAFWKDVHDTPNGFCWF